MIPRANDTMSSRMIPRANDTMSSRMIPRVNDTISPRIRADIKQDGREERP